VSQRTVLFTPGPTEVRPEVLAAMARPVISHRGEEMAALVRDILGKVGRLFQTSERVLLSTSSASGLMEGAIRNCVRHRSLHLICGAFGDRWRQIAVDCGIEPGVVEVEPGRAISAGDVERALSAGSFDAVCLTHNETSTGVTNPLEEIAAVVRRHPEVLFLVDAVSSLGGIPLDVDRFGIDVCFASVQKALALPPGFSLCTVSPRALAVAQKQKGRGYYFDFVRLSECSARGTLLATPSIPHLFALQVQLDHIAREGLEQRYARHAAMAERVRTWVRDRFALLAQAGYESNTVTCVSNTGKIGVVDFVGRLRLRGYQISQGYGSLRETTFRIGHLGDHTLGSVDGLLRAMDEVLEE